MEFEEFKKLCIEDQVGESDSSTIRYDKQFDKPQLFISKNIDKFSVENTFSKEWKIIIIHEYLINEINTIFLFYFTNPYKTRKL